MPDCNGALGRWPVFHSYSAQHERQYRTQCVRGTDHLGPLIVQVILVRFVVRESNHVNLQRSNVHNVGPQPLP